jgi:hypothetical protein
LLKRAVFANVPALENQPTNPLVVRPFCDTDHGIAARIRVLPASQVTGIVPLPDQQERDMRNEIQNLSIGDLDDVSGGWIYHYPSPTPPSSSGIAPPPPGPGPVIVQHGPFVPLPSAGMLQS